MESADRFPARVLGDAALCHDGEVRLLAVSPDGQRVLTASTSWRNRLQWALRLWDVDSGEDVFHRELPYSDPLALALTPDARFAAVAEDRRFRILDATTGAELRRFEADTASAWAVALSPDACQLACLEAGALALWDVERGALLWSVHEPQAGHLRPVFSHDGAFLLSQGPGQSFLMWEAAGGKLRRSFEGHARPVSSLAFSPSGDRVVSGSDDGSVRVWDPARGLLLRSFTAHGDVVSCVAVSGDGKWALSGSWDGTVRRWDLESLGEAGVFGTQRRRGGSGVSCVGFSPDVRRAFSGGEDQRLHVWDLEADPPASEPKRVAQVAWARFLADGKRLLWEAGGASRLFDLLEGREIEAPSESTELASPAEDFVHRRVGYDVLEVLEAATGRVVHRIHDPWLTYVAATALSPGGGLLAAVMGNQVQVWDLEEGRPPRAWGQEESLVCVAFSADGKTLATGGEAGTVRLWEAATGRDLQVLAGHQERVTALAFLPDGSRLVSAARDRTVRVWDLRGGQPLRVIRNRVFDHPGTFGTTANHIAISPDGTWIAAVNQNGTIGLYQVP